ncbi:hypothetical protein RHSIM_Rhsim02G0067700 [Rhododendron simsii]|uniref:Uncharacterized protein n=1 Tax=Rhododendron simsii TaxID=118357 RepID=A0A834HMQ5_RHOSS|nr:hypothetical protein RHSIM_Rhsim02G0067700 [Rhododendron simsii]
MGVNVTFVTAFSALNRVAKAVAHTPPGLTFSGFYDGYDDGNAHLWSNHGEADRYMKEVKIRGSVAIAELLKSAAERGQPFLLVVYTTIMAWVGQVAHALRVPSILLWLQPATILGFYYYYFNGYGESIGKNANDPSWSSGALRATVRLNFVAIGPLIPSAFLDGEDPSDTSSGGDLFQRSEDYIVWLNSKPSESVIYVAFGSYASITKRQMEEIERGLLECGRPFLWVINPSLQFAMRLVKMGVSVPFVTAFSALNRITKSSSAAPQGLTFSGFSDGYDDGSKLGDPVGIEVQNSGSKAVAELIKSEAERGRPFVHVVYTSFLPWAGRVARALHVPSTFLWIQPATILAIFYYYFNGYRDAIRNSILDGETNPKVLVNTFDALESGALRAVEKLNLVAVGPLIPSAFLDGKDPSDTSIGGDLVVDNLENEK